MLAAVNEAPPARAAWLSSAGVVLSVVAHVATFALLGAIQPPEAHQRLRPPVEVDVVTVPLPVPEPEPAPVAEPAPAPPEPKPVRAPKPERAVVAPDKPVDTRPAAAAEETIADFSGTTLTGDAAGGWASAVGSGAAMNAPIGKPRAAVTGRDASGVAGGVVGGQGTSLRIVGDSDLSRRPQLPNQDLLNAALERSYPKPAKQQGVEGTARIRVRVFASGKLEPLATLNETFPGFAEACKASLRGLSFQPGLDRAGQPVATDIPYTCTFSVE